MGTVLFACLAAAGCVGIQPDSVPLDYDQMADQPYHETPADPARVEALRQAFLSTPDFDQRMRALTLLEHQLVAMTDEPLRLGSIGSAILDKYLASLPGHQALAVFYRHVGSLEQAAIHDAWVEAIVAAVESSGAAGTEEGPYPVLSPNEAVAFLANRSQTVVGSAYHQTEDRHFLLWTAARDHNGKAVDVFFDLGDLYRMIAASVGRNPSTVFPAGPPDDCETLGLCDDFNPWAFIKVLALGDDSAAQTFIGWKLESWNDLDNAARWLQMASRAGNRLASIKLAEVLWQMSLGAEEADTREMYHTRAEGQFRTAIAAGMDTAMFDLGWLYVQGYYGEEKARDGMRLLVDAADLDNVDALTYLGWIYTEGELADEDHERAEGYFVRAAQMNDYAKVQYARFLLHPDVSRGFNERAYRWLRGIATNENADAMVLIGDLYAKGLHVGKSFRRAVSWFKNAVKAAPDDPGLVNEVAWRLTVTHLPKLRDERYALEIMERIMDESEGARRNPSYLDTWAAAYAANGDFERAIAVQEEAVERAITASDNSLDVLLEHLKAFREGRAISEPVP